MSTPPPRRFWQIHLSTAIVLMFVVGGLLLANLHTRETERAPVPDENGRVSKIIERESGWPGKFRIAYVDGIPWRDSRSMLMPLFNGFVGIALIVTVWIFLEYLIRRRESRL